MAILIDAKKIKQHFFSVIFFSRSRNILCFSTYYVIYALSLVAVLVPKKKEKTGRLQKNYIPYIRLKLTANKIMGKYFKNSREN